MTEQNAQFYDTILKSEGLSPVETYSEDGDVCFIKAERKGGLAAYYLSMIDLNTMPVFDTYTCLEVLYPEQDVKRVMVNCIPDCVKGLVEKGMTQEGLSRSEAQTLRRYLEHFDYDKLHAKALARMNTQDNREEA